MRFDDYLRRIGQPAPAGTSFEALRRLHLAHRETFLFENRTIQEGGAISLALPDLERKFIDAGRGGYCFEHNTLLAAVLESLGFAVTRLAARVRASAVPATTPIRPRTHMLLRVDLAEGPFIADVGFGGDGPPHPLPLREGETWIAGAGFRLRREGDVWVLMGRDAGADWLDLYAFTLEPQYAVDYEMANHYTSTFPRSPFVQSLTAQRSWPGGRVILRNRELTRRTGGAPESVAITDPEHLLRVLAQDFGLAFPAGTRFAKPDF